MIGRHRNCLRIADRSVIFILLSHAIRPVNFIMVGICVGRTWTASCRLAAVFLHRSQTHCAVDLHAVGGHFFHFWPWLSHIRQRSRDGQARIRKVAPRVEWLPGQANMQSGLIPQAVIRNCSIASRELLPDRLQAWCKRAKSSGIQLLKDFSTHQRSHV